MTSKSPCIKLTRRFLAIFGSPLGAQKSQKIDFFPKKPSQGALFHRFLLRMSFSSIFRLIFSRFWMKNHWKKTCFFQAPPRTFFQHGDPHETWYFIMRKLLFHFLCFCVFSKKKRRKMTPKCKEQFCITKSPKNGPRGPILGPKMDPN